MAKRTNHVVPSSSGWSVKKSGSSRASKVFDNKEMAIDYARKISITERTELYIHKKNGTIQDKRSYGNYPNAPKNKN
ncbi:MAG TPA: DUF2188 domain-containing protein [Chitinophagales bacterium]|nr:DUF2188 domain-containing protein [Chitinophagales bacterium]MCB0512550.1 DUF2188 domain-containing protein [Bacteroidota bacterium]MCB9074950.1 DUF2188 domain-containing protein [Chitinophagales bacterium]HMU98253.1 DUF2188 domain-containing protein [Chitinophagales bacterium]HMV01750.1 DUF2188 domain-containing protein [Chitinophagales bacterium]